MIRKVLFKDSFWEVTNTSPDNWTQDVGTWKVGSQGNAYVNSNSALGIKTMHPTTAIPQNEHVLLDMMFSVNNTCATNWYVGMVGYASTSSGTYYGNSYYVKCTPTETYLYSSAANELTEVTHVSATHNTTTNYYVTLEIDETNKNLLVYESTTGYDSTVAIIDVDVTTALASGDYMALYSYGVYNSYFSKVRARCPNDMTFTDQPHVFQSLGRETSFLEASVMLNSDGTVPIAVGDMVEVTISDGTTITEEFDGRVQKVTSDLESYSADIYVQDFRCEGLQNEASYNSTSADAQTAMIGIIDANMTWLKGGGVKMASDAAVARAYEGKYALEQLYDISLEVDFYMWSTFWRKFPITNIFPDPSITIDDSDPIMKAKYVEDGNNVYNIADVYWGSSLAEVNDTSGVSQAVYGKKSNLHVDPTITNATVAAGIASTLMTRYATLSKQVDIWVGDYHELMIGDKVTVTLAGLSMDAVTGIVIEKEYGGNMVCIRFRVATYVGETPYAKEPHDPIRTLAKDGLQGVQNRASDIIAIS